MSICLRVGEISLSVVFIEVFAVSAIADFQLPISQMAFDLASQIGNRQSKIKNQKCRSLLTVVRKGGPDPPHLSVPDPKSGASANSATFAKSKSTRSRIT